MGNTIDKLSGRSKEALGKVSGNKRMELKGKAQHDLAVMKEKANETAQKIEDRVDRMRQ